LDEEKVKVKKLVIAVIMMFTAGCANNFKNDFNNSPELLNRWTSKASFQQLCDGLFEYQEDSYVLNRILIEFNRRNVSYMNCRQYGGAR